MLDQIDVITDEEKEVVLTEEDEDDDDGTDEVVEEVEHPEIQAPIVEDVLDGDELD